MSRPTWMFNPPAGLPMPGAPVQTGAGGYGGGAQAIRYRDPVDAARSVGTGRTPDAEYPDGYLGNLKSRREDRLLRSIKDIINKRSYQRGVHAGERIEPQDYYWPGEFGPDSGLERQEQAVYVNGQWVVPRLQPLYTVQEQLMAGPNALPRGAESLVTLRLTPSQQQQVAHLSPKWR
jgi:hypothetical protein